MCYLYVQKCKMKLRTLDIDNITKNSRLCDKNKGKYPFKKG